MLHWVVGAGAGALLGAGLYSLHRKTRGQPIEWKGLASAAAGGLVFGVLGTAAVGSFFATATTWGQVAGLAASGAVAGAVEQTTDNALYGRPLRTDLPRTAALRAATGGAFGALGKVVAPPAAAAASRGWQAYQGALQRHPVATSAATAGVALGTAAAVVASKSQDPGSDEPGSGPAPPPAVQVGKSRRSGPGILGALNAGLGEAP